MFTAELYKQDRPRVVIEREGEESPGAWARLEEAMARGIESGSVSRTVVHADVFLAELAVIRELKSVFKVGLALGEELTAQLRRMARDRGLREQVVELGDPDDDELDALKQELRDSGFRRELRPFQLVNLYRLVNLPHGADFSVPGAGKTTVALAAFSLLRARGEIERLAVVGPLAAFGAWKEELVECFDVPPKFAVHDGPGTIVPRDAVVLLSNYHRTANDYDFVRSFVSTVPTQVILDEAHRIKRGSSGQHGRAVLDLAYAAARRDVLTGTPAPQGAHDLVALISFLYPGQDRQILPDAAYFERQGRDQDVLLATNAAVRRYFVRTPKVELDLPPTEFRVIRQAMPPIQQAIYDALLGQYRAAFALPDAPRHEMRRLGRIVMYLLEAATNPMLLLAGSEEGDIREFTHPPLPLKGGESLVRLLARYADYEDPWKYSMVEQIVEEAAARGEKVLVWSSFVRNLKLLERRLERFQPAVVHGGISSDEIAPPEVVTREREFDRFRHDDGCSVLLANPAACGEGVSLHHWCHEAVYLDRTFNAGHFLQSQDRIHRLGLDEDTMTRFTLLVSEGSIDDAVNGRLVEKVSALAVLMDDPGLVDIALPMPDEGLGGAPAAEDDFQAVLAHVTEHAAASD
ncbi:DEAD/DEAH box helicase [Qipengyuania sp. YIM B01966]|uniref:DEAD/DEAH box helicase n=1 Tax=Qipengyuania sp. YIM B01966 TaxID=2778646 RepID=UPI0018F47F2C|nr:DEAD/DEAH box helicase [Qipengyuania sp. YIM B01966]